LGNKIKVIMKDLINNQINELYESKAHFSEQIEINPKDLASKLKTVETKINWLNKFLKPLKLHVVVTRVDG